MSSSLSGNSASNARGGILGAVVDGISVGATSVVSNAGVVEGGLSGLVGGATVAVNNTGRIAGTSLDGIVLGATGTIINAATGTINGGTTGIVEAATGKVANAGSITGTTGYGINLAATGTVINALSGVITGGLAGIVGAATGTVTNSGRIISQNADGIDLAATGTVTNATSGVILGAISGVVEGVTGLVVNAGTISGGLGYGVDLTAGGTVSNAGTITGGNGVAVHFGGAVASRMIVDPGAVFIGQVVGSAGAANTLELAVGNGTLANFSTTFVNFSTIVVDAGAHWVITGADPAAIGTFTLSPGSSISINGTVYGVTLNQPAATLTLAAGATYENAALVGAGSGVSLGANGDVLNTGTIAGTTVDGIDAGAGASVTNDAGATINGALNGAVVGANETVSNAGAVTGTLGDGIDSGAGSTVANVGGIAGSSSGVAGGANVLVVNTGGSASLYLPSTINGSIFTDANANGVRETTDTGLAGATVNLLGPDGHTILATTTSAADGTYHFTGIAPGTTTVQVVPPAGDSLSTPATTTVTVTSGSTNTVSTGVYAPGTINGSVFADANANGVRETTDTGLAGATVNLLGPDGHTILATTTSAADGTYHFTGIAPGTTTVQVVPPAGDSLSTPATTTVTVTSGSTNTVSTGVYAPGTINGSVFADANANGVRETTDTGLAGATVNLLGPDGHTILATTTSAADGTYHFTGIAPGTTTVQVVPPAGDSLSTPATTTVTVTSGSTNTVSTGVYAPGTINGSVFADANANGVRETTDTGLAGATVNLLGPDGHTILATTTSAADGTYHFTGIAPGTTTVQVVPPAGDSLSTPATTTVTVTSGSTNTVSTGVYAPGTINGSVFADANANGVRETTDTGLAGATVNLLGPDGHTILATTTSAADGTYHFTGIAPGTTTVQVVPPAGDSLSTPATTTVTVTSGSTSTVSTGVYVPINPGMSGSISGLVFLDGNCNGIYHVGDPGVAAVTVRLLDSMGNPAGISTTTDSYGHYSFNKLIPGQYQVQIVGPQGTDFSKEKHASANPLLDSDVNAVSGITDVVNVVGGQTTAGVNAGMEFTGRFGGVTPNEVGNGMFLSNDDHQVVVGTGNNTVMFGAGGNNIVILDGKGLPSLVELNVGTTTSSDIDIVTSCGPLSAQSQTRGSGYLFAGDGGSSTLNGGPGNAYMMGAGSNDLIFGGSGNNVIIGGGSTGIVTTLNGVVTGYTDGDRLIAGGLSTEFLYEKGDGVVTIDGGLRAQDTLKISGYGNGTLIKLAGQDALYFGGNDLIVFHGPNPYVNGIASSIGFFDLPGNPEIAVVFGADGRPTIQSAGASMVPLAPLPPLVQVPIVPPTPVVTPPGTPGSQSIELPAYGAIFDWHTAQSGSHVDTHLSGSLGSATITVGDGANTVASGGSGNVITAGFGDNTIDAGESNLTVVVGNGNNTINAIGYNNKITAGNGTNLITAGASGSHVAVGNGDDTITANGWGNVVTAGNGDHTITAGYGNETVTVGVGNNHIDMGGYSNNITAGNGSAVIDAGEGNAHVVAGNGNTTVTVNGWGNVITAGDGDHIIAAGYGNEKVTVGIGNNHIDIGGYSNTITTKDGDNIINSGLGNSTVTTGSGSNTINAQGYNNSITTGAGTSFINAGLGNSFVNTGAGDDTVFFDGYSNVLIGGLGHDVISGGQGNIYQVNGVGHNGRMDILDFSLNNGDVLDVSDILQKSDWNGSENSLGSYLKVSEVGGNTVVEIDLSGQHSNFLTVATLFNAGASSLGDLQAHHSIATF